MPREDRERRDLMLELSQCSRHGWLVRLTNRYGSSLTFADLTNASPTVQAFTGPAIAHGDIGDRRMRLVGPRQMRAWVGDQPVIEPVGTCVLFAMHGLSREQMESFLAHGVSDVRAAAAWCRTDLIADLSEVPTWVAAGVVDPRPAQDWLSTFEDPAYPRRSRALGPVRATPEWAALAEKVTYPFAAVGHAHGQSPAGVVALAKALTETGAQKHLSVARALAGLDWVNAAACVSIGMSVDEAVEHLRSGADMGPVRLLAALGD